MSDDAQLRKTFETLLSELQELSLKGHRQLADGAPVDDVYGTLMQALEIHDKAHTAYYVFRVKTEPPRP